MSTPLSHKQIIGLHVETQSGQPLGKVQELFVDADTQAVVQYAVRNQNLFKELFTKDLLIAAKQVIALTPEKLIVEDLAITNAEAAPSPQKPTPAPELS